MLGELTRDRIADRAPANSQEFFQRPSEVEVRRLVKKCLRDDIGGSQQEHLVKFLYEGAFNAYSYALRGGSPRIEHHQDAGRHVFRVLDKGVGILRHYRASAFGSQSTPAGVSNRDLLTSILTTQISSTPDPSAGWGTVDMLRAARQLGEMEALKDLSLETSGIRMQWNDRAQSPSCQSASDNGTTWEIAISAR